MDHTMTEATQKPAESAVTRRSVFNLALGTGVAAVAFAAGPDLNLSMAFARRGASFGGTVDLGSGDVGVLNYAYALEQLEAAFYTQVMARPYSGMSGREHSLLSDIRRHEVAHREFLRRALGGNAIPGLEVDFSSVDFSSRTSVLTTAVTFEDLGVSAYNGAARYLHNPAYLAAAGRIVSVEGRHAAILHDMLEPFGSSFATTDLLGQDVEHSPGFVLSKASPYIATPVSGSQVGI
jgi:rubrerythrin